MTKALHHRTGVIGSTRVPQAPSDPMARIGSKIVPQPNGCWAWTDHDLTSYVVTTIEGETGSAHRIVYQLCRGKLPDDLVLHHECQRPGCVNPDHLRPMANGDHVAMHANATWAKVDRRYPLAPVERLALERHPGGGTADDGPGGLRRVLTSAGFAHRSAGTWRRKGISRLTAERLAATLAVDPKSLWPDWADGT